jgi:NTE family protein
MSESIRAHIPPSALRHIELFQDLPDEELERLAARLRTWHAPRGTVVFKKGDPGDALYMIETGQVMVLSEESNEPVVGATLGPDTPFGETSLLTGEPRSRTLVVSIDAVLWVLSKEDFETELHNLPSMAVNLSRSLARRLYLSTQESPTSAAEVSTRLVGVIGTLEETIQLAQLLAMRSLHEVLILDVIDTGDENSTVDPSEPFHDVVDISEGVARLDVAVELSSGDFSEVVSQLLRKYDHLMVRLPDQESSYVLEALDLCEVVVTFGTQEYHRHWVRGIEQAAKKLRQMIASGDPNFRQDRAERDRDRLARTLVGRRIGLALSSGGAHGLAHIGVLNILEQEKIPIDFVGGTSMGSIIGGAYAAGCRGKELYRVGWEAGRMFNFRTGWRSWDLRLSRSGLMRGEIFRKAAERWTHGMRFEDLETELFLVAAEVVSGREVVFHEGLVADAIRASVSVPMAFTPVPYGNDFLFDGACADPVPCKPLADAGADIVIACNAIPQVEDRLYRKVRQHVGPGRAPGMFEVSQSEREIMSAQVALLKMHPVDVLITPKVGMYSWMEGNRIDTFVRIGEEAARAAVPKIKELLKPGVRRTRRVWV